MAQKQRNKKPQGGGPDAHPTNRGPGKGAAERGRVEPGGNKVRQGKGHDTGNKGKH
jgi:hypothetical protein